MAMKHTPASPLEEQARRLYRQAVTDVDPATAARLRAARRTALEVGSEHHPLRWMVPAGAVAASVLAVVLMWRPMPHPAMPTTTPAAQIAARSTDNDLPPDPDSADPAMVEDMGFYAWLADQPTSKSMH
jgi:hypothetical protein